jgi:hypothetical protein
MRYQLQPEDTLIDRGVDDKLDEGYSPPGSLARTLRQTWSLMTSVSTEEQPPPRRPQFTSSTMRSSWPLFALRGSDVTVVMPVAACCV